jgi:hypothetical protein
MNDGINVPVNGSLHPNISCRLRPLQREHLGITDFEGMSRVMREKRESSHRTGGIHLGRNSTFEMQSFSSSGLNQLISTRCTTVGA